MKEEDYNSKGEIMDKKKFKKIFLPLILFLLVLIPAIGYLDGNSFNTNLLTANVVKENINLDNIPVYSGKPYVEINNNIPYFNDKDLVLDSYEKYSKKDSLNRCGTAISNISIELMPTTKRGSIGMIKPSGWHTVKYDNIDGKYLYNRCHLIGFQLTGETTNEDNLITGTRYLNVEGMLPFENMVADYIKETNNHVLYRVTPIFKDDNLVASGVLMEALSVEDKGNGIKFNVYCYNVQPGIIIDYKTGDSRLEVDDNEINNKETYIINTNTKKIHKKDCSSVKDINPKYYKEYNGNINKLLKRGYTFCKRCNR